MYVLNISHGSVFTIVQDHLHETRLCKVGAETANVWREASGSVLGALAAGRRAWWGLPKFHHYWQWELLQHYDPESKQTNTV